MKLPRRVQPPRHPSPPAQPSRSLSTAPPGPASGSSRPRSRRHAGGLGIAEFKSSWGQVGRDCDLRCLSPSHTTDLSHRHSRGPRPTLKPLPPRHRPVRPTTTLTHICRDEPTGVWWAVPTRSWDGHGPKDRKVAEELSLKGFVLGRVTPIHLEHRDQIAYNCKFVNRGTSIIRILQIIKSLHQ